jgi:hypothetical protein
LPTAKAIWLQFLQPRSRRAHILIDGRNRLRACEIARVKPRFEQRSSATSQQGQIAITLARVRFIDSIKLTQEALAKFWPLVARAQQAAMPVMA